MSSATSPRPGWDAPVAPPAPFRLRHLPSRGRVRGYDTQDWAIPHRGVRRPTHDESTRTRIAAAALLLPPTGAIGGWAAAHLRGVPWHEGTRADGTALSVPLVVPPPAQIRPQAGVLVCRSTLDPAEVDVVDGLRVTGHARTAFDLARAGSVADALGSVDAYLRATRLSRAELWAEVAKRGRWTGVPQARVVAGLADPMAASPQESWLRLVWLQAGLPMPLVNVPVFDRDGVFVGKPDLLDPASGLAGEYEGDQHRTDATQWRTDVGRYRRFERLGLLVVRATAADRRNPAELIAALVRARRRGLARQRSSDGWSLGRNRPHPPRTV